MNDQFLRDLVASTSDLAVLPVTVIRLLDVLRDEMCSAVAVAEILDRDVAMTTNVLRVANSAFYGGGREIGAPSEALVMLGNRAVAALAFTAGMAPVMRRDLVSYGIGRDHYWKHCLLTATAASLAAPRLHADLHPCRAFTGGLIHDVGMLVLDRHLLDRRDRLPAGIPAGDICERERATVGFDHMQVGALLAQQWAFPEQLERAAAHHHDPAGAGIWLDEVSVIAVGDLVARMVQDDVPPSVEPDVVAHIAALGLDLDFLEGMKDDLVSDFESCFARATSSAVVQA